MTGDPVTGPAAEPAPGGTVAGDGIPDADLVLDARGRRCPLPVIELARHVGEVAVDGVVAVLCDDPAARLDIPEWCRMRGQDYLGAAPYAPGAARYAPGAAPARPGDPTAGPPPAATVYRVRRRS